MTSKAELQDWLTRAQKSSEDAWDRVQRLTEEKYALEREHDRQINQIIDVLGFRNDYRMSKKADRLLDVTGVDSFLADIAAAATAIESAAAKRRLGIK